MWNKDFKKKGSKKLKNISESRIKIVIPLRKLPHTFIMKRKFKVNFSVKFVKKHSRVKISSETIKNQNSTNKWSRLLRKKWCWRNKFCKKLKKRSLQPKRKKKKNLHPLRREIKRRKRLNSNSLRNSLAQKTKKKLNLRLNKKKKRKKRSRRKKR